MRNFSENKNQLEVLRSPIAVGMLVFSAYLSCAAPVYGPKPDSAIFEASERLRGIGYNVFEDHQEASSRLHVLPRQLTLVEIKSELDGRSQEVACEEFKRLYGRNQESAQRVQDQHKLVVRLMESGAEHDELMEALDKLKKTVREREQLLEAYRLESEKAGPEYSVKLFQNYAEADAQVSDELPEFTLERLRAKLVVGALDSEGSEAALIEETPDGLLYEFKTPSKLLHVCSHQVDSSSGSAEEMIKNSLWGMWSFKVLLNSEAAEENQESWLPLMLEAKILE